MSWHNQLSSMDLSNISRLKEEQLKAISETEEKINHFEKYKADYKALQKRLKTLPDKTSHDVMVPFGKLAFMPGRIVHTNEILVLLGDNWFVDRSAKQACQIADRRSKELDKRINELKEQMSLLKPRLGMTSELEAQIEGKTECQEIVEEYDEEKERLWDEQHKKNVQSYHEKLRKKKDAAKKNEAEESTDMEGAAIQLDENNDLWARLNALEKQEDERNELNRLSDSDEAEDSEEYEDKKPVQKHFGDKEISVPQTKRVSWVDQKKDQEDEDYDDDGDDEDSDDKDEGSNDDTSVNVEESQQYPVIKTITFSHTRTPDTIPAQVGLGSTPNVSGSGITSPADIYKLFSPKPILKKSAESLSQQPMPTQPDDSGDHVACSLPPKTHSSGACDKSEELSISRDKAFCGVVKESQVLNPCHTSFTSNDSAGSQHQEQDNAPVKKVSRFKAQRMAQRPT